MRYTITCLFLLFTFTNTQVLAQDFFDDFESYAVGDYLAANSPDWTTWDGIEGGETDVQITDAKSFSGNKSIYFEGTEFSGGPQDIVLPFGGLKKSGVLHLEMMMYIPSQTTNNPAYFNLQGDTTLGNIWAMQCRFRDDNRLIISNSGPLHIGEFIYYEFDRWFQITIHVNLDENKWTFSSLEDYHYVQFENLQNQVSHLNIFPSNKGTSFYIDDVKYTYSNDPNPIERDYAITQVEWENSEFVNTKGGMSAYLKNNVGEDIQTAVFRIIDEDESYLDTLEDIHISEGEVYKYTSSKEITITEWYTEINVELVSVNGQHEDDLNYNHRLSEHFYITTPAPYRSVLVEELTSTFCDRCPEGIVMRRKMKDHYPKRFVPIAIHTSDPMNNSSYTDSIKEVKGIQTTPAWLFDRQEESFTSFDFFESEVIQRVTRSTMAKLTNGAKFNPETRELDISVTTYKLNDALGDYRILVVVTEDSIKGTGPDYDQANAYSDGDIGAMGGFEVLPNPVPADSMIYNDVARVLLGEFRGHNGKLPDPMEAGSEFILNYSWTIPEEFKTEHLNIISIILRPDGVVDNVKLATFDQALDKGYVTNSSNHVINNSVDVFPNPTSNASHVRLNFEQAQKVQLSIINSSGVVIEQRDYDILQGNYLFPLELNGLPSGTYYLHIQTQKGLVVKKLIVTP